MKLKKTFLKSKIAKRVIWLFLVSALTPIIAITILSATYVTSLLTEEANVQLLRANKLYGMSLLDKLLLVEDNLNIAARLVASGQTKLVTLNENSEYEMSADGKLFSKSKLLNKIILDKEPVSKAVWDKYKKTGKPVLFSKIKPNGNTAIYMRVMLGGKNNPASSLVAEINNDYLWGSRDRLPFSSMLCVIEDGNKVLFSSHPSQNGFIVDNVNSSSPLVQSRYFEWEDEGESYQTVQWELFIKSRFIGPRWKITTSQRKTDVLKPVRSFGKVFPLVLMLSLLIVLLLSVVQIRLSINPLERLIQGTKRVLNKEYGSLVKIDSNDEFADLADAFNTMTLQIGKQINILKKLSEIDNLILSNPTIDKVLITLLEGAHNIISCDLVAITLIEKNDFSRGFTHVSDRINTEEPSILFTDIPDSELSKLTDSNEVAFIDLKTEKRTSLEYLAGRNMNFAYTYNVIHDGEPRAILTLASVSNLIPTKEENEYIHDMLDRFAVALAAADRDEKLYQQAHFDALTQLPNRQLMNDRLKQHILHSRREQQMVGVFYIDIDRFKNVNDSLGHNAGDELLVKIAQRLKQCVRDEDTVSRLGGDEFVVVLPDIENSKNLSHISEKIVQSISKPFTILSREIFVTPSIGITAYPMDGITNEDLLKKADSAMYRAKQSGRGKYVFFEEKMNLEDMERIEIEQDLRNALLNKELELFYQPQFDLSTGSTIGAEALLRWNHPQRGIVSPVDFIPIAEESGLIESIGEWVLRTACHQFSEWQQQGLSMEYIAVNVSSRQFNQPQFLEIVKSTLETTRILPGQLELEITESVLMSDEFDTQHLFDNLISLGVKIAIDDFGTGYSSLSYLKRFPVHTLKIDRSFISEIPDDQNTITIAYSIIALAQALNMTVVAEGIETKEQLDILEARSCNYGQGYYYSKPVSQESFTNFLLQQNETKSITAKTSGYK